MKKLLQSDKRKRKFVYNLEINHYVAKAVFKNSNYSKFIRWNEMSKFLRKASVTQTVNRCILTGRKARVNKLYNYSRLVFLRLVRAGLLSGLKKSSW